MIAIRTHRQAADEQQHLAIQLVVEHAGSGVAHITCVVAIPVRLVRVGVGDAVVLSVNDAITVRVIRRSRPDISSRDIGNGLVLEFSSVGCERVDRLRTIGQANIEHRCRVRAAGIAGGRVEPIAHVWSAVEVRQGIDRGSPAGRRVVARQTGDH